MTTCVSGRPEVTATVAGIAPHGAVTAGVVRTTRV
jgi:hypothetical protein